MPEMRENSSVKTPDLVSCDMGSSVESKGRVLHRGLSGAVEPVSKHRIIKNECV